MDAGSGSSSPLAARAVTLDLLSPLPAPFGVHAQDKQARNRWETVWSLSEIDKIGDGVFTSLCTLTRKPCDGNGDFLLSPSNAFALESPRSAELFFEINAVKVFSSAVYQQTALYALAGKAGARVQVAYIQWMLQHYTSAQNYIYWLMLAVRFCWKNVLLAYNFNYSVLTLKTVHSPNNICV